MKKFILLLGAIYVLTLISFNEPKESPKSFSEMIKNDPSRIKELLALADSLSKNKNEKLNLPDAINDSDLITAAEVAVLRKKSGRNNWPVMRIAASEMQEIIGDPKEIQPADTLSFYLISYKEKQDYPAGVGDSIPRRMGRYNTRSHGKKGEIDIKKLAGQLSFLIQSSSHAKGILPTSSYYSVARICPPPSGGGCD